jgi:hypothetical protein
MSLERLLKNLGFPHDDIEPMREGAPSIPVDIEKIRKFYRGQLDAVEQLEISFLITHERAWYDCSTNVLVTSGSEISSSDEANHKDSAGE